MSGPFGSSQWMYNPSAGFYGTEIENSLRFNNPDQPRLTRAVIHNTKTFTINFWVKRANLGRYWLYGVYSNSANTANLNFEADGTLVFYDYLSGYRFNLVTTRVFRDVGAWYCITLSVDTTQSTASDRIKLYINGVQETSFSTATYPSQNLDLKFGGGGTHAIGTEGLNNRLWWDGYLANWALIDGQQLEPSSFGEFKSGIWVPKDITGLTYGTGGYLLEFAGNVNDTSGNGNNWTANNISAYDYVPDSPTNNFATFSPLAQHRNGTSFLGKGTLSEGNLLTTNNSDNEGSVIPFAPASGKWYVEFCSKNLAQRQTITAFGNDGFNFASTYVATRSDGGENATGDQSWTTGDIIGVAYDFDNGKVWFAKNNTWYNSSNPATNTGGDAMSALYGFSVHQVSGSTGSATTVFNAGQDSSFAGTKTAQGNTDGNGIGDFYYSPPSGFLAMCSANLPAPAIDPAADETPEDYFNTVLYTGDGTANRTISAGLTPDFVWMKDRSAAYSHILIDSVRGNGNYLTTNGTNQENWAGNLFPNSGSTTNGFVVDGNLNVSINANGDSYVAWNWKAGGTGVTNTDGSITSTVSANPDAGFSVLTYSPSGSSGSVGHGLGVTPDAVIVKRTDASGNWVSHWPAISGTNKQLYLNLTNSVDTNNISSLTSTTFSVSGWNDVATAGGSYVAYCFADIDGFSKAGSYVGNGSSDGSFIYTGFRPAWVMTKNINVSSHHWTIYDNKRGTYNAIDPFIYANLSSAENNTGDQIDFLSNGFKARVNDWNLNYGGVSYIFLAFAEQPFKYANAR